MDDFAKDYLKGYRAAVNQMKSLLNSMETAAASMDKDYITNPQTPCQDK